MCPKPGVPSTYDVATVIRIEGLEEDLAELVRAVVREELGARESEPRGWLNVESAAAYLDSTPEAVRSAEKRGQLHAHRSGTGRLMFLREDLDAFARGEAA